MSKFFSYFLIRDSFWGKTYLVCHVMSTLGFICDKKNTCIWFHKLDQILNSSVCSTSAKHPAICLVRRLQMWKKNFVTKNAERESRWIMVAGVLLKAAPFSVGIHYHLKTYILSLTGNSWVHFLGSARHGSLSGAFSHYFFVTSHRCPFTQPCT